MHLDIQKIELPNMPRLPSASGLGLSQSPNSDAATRATDDGQNPALPIIRNIQEFPLFRILRVMQDFVHQP